MLSYSNKYECTYKDFPRYLKYCEYVAHYVKNNKSKN